MTTWNADEIIRLHRSVGFHLDNSGDSLVQEEENALHDIQDKLANEVVRLERGDMDDAPPIPMPLFCPACKTRHVDVGEFATKPHRIHTCQNKACGISWKQAEVATVGVLFLPGTENNPAAPALLTDLPPPVKRPLRKR